MKIIEYIKKKTLQSELDDIKDYVFTQLEDFEVFNGIKPALELKSNFSSFGPVTTKLLSTTVYVDKLEDKKVYPAIHFAVLVSCDGRLSTAHVYIDPFRCFRIDDHYVYENTAKKNVSKGLRQFMAEKFGEVYIEKCKEYFQTVKNLKIEQAKAEADLKIKEAEKEFEDNLI